MAYFQSPQSWSESTSYFQAPLSRPGWGRSCPGGPTPWRAAPWPAARPVSSATRRPRPCRGQGPPPRRPRPSRAATTGRSPGRRTTRRTTTRPLPPRASPPQEGTGRRRAGGRPSGRSSRPSWRSPPASPRSTSGGPTERLGRLYSVHCTREGSLSLSWTSLFFYYTHTHTHTHTHTRQGWTEKFLLLSLFDVRHRQAQVFEGLGLIKEHRGIVHSKCACVCLCVHKWMTLKSLTRRIHM